MNDARYDWLRWVGVIPGSILDAFLSTFLLHWILYFTLANEETISGVNIEPIEFNLYPFVMAISFILIGFEIAPKYKFKTSLTLSALYVVIFIGLLVYMPSDMVVLQPRSLFALLGVALGVYIAWRKSKTIQMLNSPHNNE